VHLVGFIIRGYNSLIRRDSNRPFLSNLSASSFHVIPRCQCIHIPVTLLDPIIFSRVCILSHTAADSMVVLASAAIATLLSEQICAPQDCHHFSLRHWSRFPFATHSLFPYIFILARLNNVVLFETSLLACIRRKALRTLTEVVIAKYCPTMNTCFSCEKKSCNRL